MPSHLFTLSISVSVVYCGLFILVTTLLWPRYRFSYIHGYDIGSDVGGDAKPTKNIVFLKVHKASSSVIANMLQRFGYTEDLIFALPRKGRHTENYSNYIGPWGGTLARQFVRPIPDNQTYNILWNHVIYNRQAFRKVMPSDSVYVTIIRDPFAQFKSAFDYFFYYRKIAGGVNELKLHAYLEELTPKHLSGVAAFQYSAMRNMPYLINRQSIDLGINVSQMDDMMYVDQFIKAIDEDVHFVMIVEFFAESLIMLKRLLHWSAKDILNIKFNQNPNKINFLVTDRDREIHSRICAADIRLYQYFRSRFERHLLNQGQDFKEEVDHFKKLLPTVEHFCSAILQAKAGSGPVNLDNANVMIVDSTKWDPSFNVSSLDCKMMSLPEPDFLELLHARHLKRFKQLNNGSTRAKRSASVYTHHTIKLKPKQSKKKKKRIYNHQ